MLSMESEADNQNIVQKDRKKAFWEIVSFGIMAFIIVLPIRLFIAQPFVVSGSSMVPTFQNNDYLIIDELSYKFSEPKRGDVIVFRYPNNPSQFFIKRIIGLPNETVGINGSTITIHNLENDDGFILDEPYIEYKSNNTVRETLGEDEYFVMGDNRSASSDSRVWGPLEKDLVTGRVFLRLLPIKNISVLPGNI